MTLNRQPAILRLTMTIGETSAPYNQFTLPLRSHQEITLCSYLPATVKAPADLRLIEGDGTILGFWRRVGQLLRGQPYDLIHVHDPVVANLFLLLICVTNPRLLSISIFTVHNSHENFKLRNRLLLLPIFGLFQKVICCSKASYESFPMLYRFLAGQRLTYVQNGMDIERVDRTLAPERGVAPGSDVASKRSVAQSMRAQHSIKDDPFTIVSVGRLIPIKNPLTLLDAFIDSDLANGHLVFIGVGPMQEALGAKAKAAGIAERVEFTGLLSRDEVYERLAAADLFVSTSYGEGLPIAVLEAMACQTPVVLSAIEPHREITEMLEGIPLLDADDTQGFAQALQHFAAISDAERAESGSRCRKHVDDYFSLAQMHRGYAAIYDEIIGGGGSGLTRPREMPESASH